MASSSPRSVTPTNYMDTTPAASAMQNPAHSKSKAAVASTSPPRTPRRRKDPPSSYPKSARLAAATSATPPDDQSAHDHDSITDDEAEDPHDLKYRPKHFPRASMVDNMAMALDQISNPTIESVYHEGDPKTYRIRGHTVSSSVSSDSDIRSLQPKSPPSQNPRLARGSSARQLRDPSRLPSIFGEDEDSARNSRVFIGQITSQSTQPRKSRVNMDQHKANDSITSIDLSHLHRLQGKLGPAGNRRSQSFDFGSRRPADEDIYSNIPTSTPVTHSGVDAHETSTSPTLQPISVGRRNSTKSAKNTRNKPSTLGTSAVHGTGAPQLPQLASTPSDKRSTIIQANEHTPTSRPGLFRRFFTSSRSTQNLAAAAAVRPSIDQNYSSNNASPAPYPTTSKLHKHSHKSSVDTMNKENIPPQAIQKKPSSFFRRRKKSTNTATLPPMPLTLNQIMTDEPQPGQPSPVSSLKAFMDPYLNGEQSQAEQSTNSPLHTYYTANQDSAGSGVTRTDSSEPSKSTQKDVQRLSVPHKETFLTDTSSAEDVPADTDHSVEDTDHVNTPSQWPPIAPRTSSVSTPRAITNPPIPTIRPVIETRSTSWHPDRQSIVPPRKQSLSATDKSQNLGSSPTEEIIPLQRNLSGSDVSDYRSAPSTPAIVQNIPDPIVTISPRFHISHPSIGQGANPIEAEKAQRIYDNSEEEIEGRTAAVWLGEAGSERERVRTAYFNLYDFTSHNILAALRSLCSRLVLKAESQLIDRILDAFAKRWCECNPNHGFKSSDIVHTVCYSLLLLNTDLHMADIGSKMTRNQFIRNAMQTIREVVADTSDVNSLRLPNQHLGIRSSSAVDLDSDRISVERNARAASALSHRPSDRLMRSDSNDTDTNVTSGPLVDVAFSGSQGGWELEIEAVLKGFYFSISKEPLPLFGSEPNRRFPPVASNNNLLSLNSLRRTPSVLSKTQSESSRSRYGGESRSLGSKWNGKGRSRQRLGSTPGFGSSKNSLDDQSSAWSPSMSSTWSKASLGKTLTSMSVDSFATGSNVPNDYQSSIGFANALSQAIIREDQMETQTDDGTSKVVPLLEDESLELEGAPWAKEGILKHKCHLDGVDKRSKDRNWNDCFAVIEKGWMRLFSFTMTAKSLRHKARTQKPGGVVGGGNWQDNAEEVWKFMLRHTIASSLPPPGYSKTRPHVWALSLPTGAVHLFSVGTPDIVKEFVSTANFWSARLSKEPMIGGISSMEYGWSDAVLERAGAYANGGTEGAVRPSFSSKEMARPSTQMSMRSSLDYAGGPRARLPGDRIHISDWAPPQQSLLASQLLDVDQMKALQNYVAHVEEDLQRHNELRAPMLVAFSTKHPNYTRAMSNWEKKSSYLLREIVKFKNYIDALQSAQQAKERIYKMRQQEQQQRMDDDDSFALHASASLSSSGA